MAIGVALGLAAGPVEASAYRASVTPTGGGIPVQLYVEEHGNGRPLVLLHGMGGSGYSFRHLVGPLARSHRVITLDLKGFGASEKPLDTAYGPRDQARLVTAFLRQRRLTGVTLLGHSFGAAVALVTALDLNRTEPGRVSRLILLNAPAYPQPVPMAQRLLAAPIIGHLALAVVPPILNTRAALQSRRRSAPPASDADAIVYADPLHETGGRHALITTSRIMAEVDGRDVIPYYRTLRQPTLLVWCRDDRTVPLASGERLARDMPHARLAVIDACDHKPAEEAPAETLRVLQGFLSRP